ncbi:MAG: hypothetical protein QOJ93_1813 [Actinomycetota bacterium]|nr:hypothetical protein [Actinomycetota bacterium]
MIFIFRCHTILGTLTPDPARPNGTSAGGSRLAAEEGFHLPGHPLRSLRRFWSLGEERIILATALMAHLRKRTNAQRLGLSTCKAGALPTELRPHRMQPDLRKYLLVSRTTCRTAQLSVRLVHGDRSSIKLESAPTDPMASIVGETGRWPSWRSWTPRNQVAVRPRQDRAYRSWPWRTTQIVIGFPSVPSRRTRTRCSSSAAAILSSTSLVHSLMFRPPP